MRGLIRNREYAQQIRDFSGLRYGSITPTDIDGFLEFGARLFVLFEGKHGRAPMPRGQRLAFERVVDALHAPPDRHAVGFVVSHDTTGDIDYAHLPVVRVRFGGQWLERSGALTLRQSVDAFLLFCGGCVR